MDIVEFTRGVQTIHTRHGNVENDEIGVYFGGAFDASSPSEASPQISKPDVSSSLRIPVRTEALSSTMKTRYSMPPPR